MCMLGSCKRYGRPHRQSRSNHLPTCCTSIVTMGPLGTTDPAEVPPFPRKQLCPHTSSASKVCWGGQGTLGPSGEPLPTSAHIYSVCLPSGWPLHPSPQVHYLGGTSHIMPAPFSSIDKALVLSATPQSKAAQETHSGSHALVPPVWAETSLPRCWERSPEHCSNPGHLPPPCSAALPYPAHCLLRDFAPSYRWHSACFQGFNCSPLWCQERLARLIKARLNHLPWPFMLWRQAMLSLKSFRQLACTQSGPFDRKHPWCFLSVLSTAVWRSTGELPSEHQNWLTPAQPSPRVLSAMLKSSWGDRWRQSEAQWVCGATRASSSSPHHSSSQPAVGLRQQLSFAPHLQVGSVETSLSAEAASHPSTKNQSLPHLLHASCQARETPLEVSQPCRQERHCLTGPQALRIPMLCSPHRPAWKPVPTFLLPYHHHGITL